MRENRRHSAIGLGRRKIQGTSALFYGHLFCSHQTAQRSAAMHRTPKAAAYYFIFILLCSGTAMAQQVPQRMNDRSHTSSGSGMGATPSPSPSPSPTRAGEPASNSGRDGAGYSSPRSGSSSTSSNSTSLERQRQNAKDIENHTRRNQ